ncbi:MAG TPA: STAS domain-containing protein [Desulfuromonadaceae bacterium]|jgi:anti-anti-sigma regulatory factor
MSSSFGVTARCADSTDYIELSGNIDASAEQQLQMLPGMVRCQVVRIDFSRARRINSMGIALLLRCFKHIREKNKAEIVLRELNPTNTILFKMTGIFLLASHEK